jgi:AraC-like DNA-binding protein
MSLRNMQKLVSATGHTPTGLLHQARVERAKNLLLTTDLSVADVAAAVGYLDVSHFSRTFRRLTGHSPGRFRAANS